MNAKSILLLSFFIASFLSKAQIQSLEYPSGYLTEEKIKEILEQSRKSGTQEWEVQRACDILHKQLRKQMEAKSDGSFDQRISPLAQVNSSACVNPGFENGTSSNWSLYSGNINGVNLPCNTCATTTLGVISNVVNAASTVAGQCTTGVDVYGNFPVLSPTGGTNALLLNNVNAGGKIMKASYSFVVVSANDFFTFQYAIVLQSGGHAQSQQPYFAVNLTDVNTGLVIPCTAYSPVCPSSGNIAGWLISAIDPTVYVKPWTTVGVDLSGVLGHTVTANFTVSDCNQGGHFGYCYIDASCSGQYQITASNALCASSSTTLFAPIGYSNYSWAGPVTGTSSSLVTNLPGTYTLTTSYATGCPDSLVYNVTLNPTSPPRIKIQASQDTVCSGASLLLTASGASTYTWSTSATGNSITVSPSSTSTYGYCKWLQ